MEALNELSPELKKVAPKHICLAIMAENEVSFEDVTKIALWCHSIGVKYLSFYDVAGKFQQFEEILLKIPGNMSLTSTPNKLEEDLISETLLLQE